MENYAGRTESETNCIHAYVIYLGDIQWLSNKPGKTSAQLDQFKVQYESVVSQK